MGQTKSGLKLRKGKLRSDFGMNILEELWYGNIEPAEYDIFTHEQ